MNLRPSDPQSDALNQAAPRPDFPCDSSFIRFSHFDKPPSLRVRAKFIAICLNSTVRGDDIDPILGGNAPFKTGRSRRLPFVFVVFVWLELRPLDFPTHFVYIIGQPSNVLFFATSIERKKHMCRNCLLNRREFVGTVGVLAAGTLLANNALIGEETAPNAAEFQWTPYAPLIHPCQALKVQPVLMYRDQPFRELASYKSWGHVHSKETAEEEANRINQELKQMKASAEFAVEFLPLITVTDPEEAQKIHQQDYDVVLLYAATGYGDLLNACLAPDPIKDSIIFVRHRNGPIYY